MSKTNKHKYNRRRKKELRNRARGQTYKETIQTLLYPTTPESEQVSTEDALAKMMERRAKL